MRLSKVASCSSTSCSQTGMLSGEADRHMEGNAERCTGRASFPVPEPMGHSPGGSRKQRASH